MRPTLHVPLLAAAVTIVAMALVVSSCAPSQPRTLPPLGELIEQLSEKGGYFDTDNLISNETAYLQVIDNLEPTGGVYVGVGPQQNFHYIGRLRPTWAFIVDIRYDNMLHHLLLNALLVNAENPPEYVCWLFSRRCDLPSEVPEALDRWLPLVEASPPDEDRYRANLKKVFSHVENRLEYPLSAAARRRVEFIYRSYFDEQLGLRFRSHGRRPMPHHPTYRRLLVAETPAGELAHFLSRAGDYDYVRELAKSDRLVPVVGDFAGEHALRRIAQFIEDRGETVTAFYVSNVEFYLIRNGVFPDYVENVRALPRADSARFIRAYFSYGYRHPHAMPGHRSTVIRQKIKRFLELYDAAAFSNYWDVSTLDYEP